uniref:Serpentine Receptor, class E (Epsilon) n=1 Tax=Steinernema glaseri TaxID=37863 RepID=A0A1I7ZH50_9BILA
MEATMLAPTSPYIEYFEIALNLFCPVFNFYLMYLLKRPFFHINLRILLVSLFGGWYMPLAQGNFSASLVLHAVTRIVIIIYEHSQFLSPETIRLVLFLNRACAFCVMDASLAIAVERVVATWMVDRYEAIQHTSAVILLCIFLWFINGGLSIATHTLVYNGKQETYFLPLIIIFSGVLICNFCGAVSFMLVRLYNQKQWRVELERKLTHRYQIAENVRTSWQMLVVSFVDFAISVLFFFAYYRVIIYSFDDITGVILLQMFTLTVGVSGIVLPCFLIKTHPRLYLNVRLHFCPNSIISSVHYLSTAESADIETQMHFQQLKLSWA